MSKETFQEQLERLEMMAEGSPGWDLSDNDQAAITALLEAYRDLKFIYDGLCK